MTRTSWPLPELAHPYQVRAQRDTFHYNTYGEAAADFNDLATAEAHQWEISFWERSDDRRDWHLISLAGPYDAPLRHPWANLFAGLTLSQLFRLRPDTRAQLTRIGWPAPPDAELWRYATPDDAPTPAATTPAPAPENTPEATPAMYQGVDLDAWAADPACRVDRATLERRLRSGWGLERALTTPLTPMARDELRWFGDPRRPGYRVPTPGARRPRHRNS